MREGTKLLIGLVITTLIFFSIGFAIGWNIKDKKIKTRNDRMKSAFFNGAMGIVAMIVMLIVAYFVMAFSSSNMP